MALRASQEDARSIIPTTVAEALDLYERAMAARRQPSEWTRKQSVRYARLACTHMKAASAPLAAVSARMVRMLVETVPGGDAQRKHIYGGLNRFLGWCRKQGLIETNPCDALDRSEKPKPGAARDHVPSIAMLRAIWAAAESESALARDLLRFMLLMPLRRKEATGLRWSEVDLGQGRIRITADRMKGRKAHELPLSPPARAILEARRANAAAGGDFVFSSNGGGRYTSWARLLARIRKRVDGASVDDFIPHDIRRGFVSHLAGRFDVDALDQCLAHVRGGVTGIYQRSQRWPNRERAINAWADMISEAEPDSNVVPLRAARKVV